MPSDVTSSDPRRKPRLILLGEFSAGKSTLVNALLGISVSPMRVTATHLPPIWYRFGADAAEWVDADGAAHALPDGDVAHAPLGETHHLCVTCPAPVLERMDILDMPGSSDPNMAAEIWDSLLPEADLAIWCTPAAQSWRQSEAALWEMMPDPLKQKGLLAITRMDKVPTPADRTRVLARVDRETRGTFAGLYPLSLTEAVLTDHSETAREGAGLTALEAALTALLEGRSPPRSTQVHAPAAAPLAHPPEHVAPRRIATRMGTHSRGESRHGL